MTKKALLKTCELLYATHYLPIAAFCKGELIALNCSYPGFAPIFKKLAERAGGEEHSLISGKAGLYGCVRVKKYDILLISGPYVNKKADGELYDSVIHEYSLPWEEREPLMLFISSLPRYSLNRFLNFLSLLSFLFNGEELSVTDYFKNAEPTLQREIGMRHTREIVDEENSFAHGTYDLERKLLAYVSAGNVEGLSAFFDKIARSRPMTEGKLAEDSLRQSKNIFIGLVTMVGKVGAIRGNLDIEQTYALIDLYTQECEKCTTISQVNQLRYTAVLDFTRRVAEQRHPESYSAEVYKALQFIKSHTNRPIGVPDVIEHVKMSRSVFMEKFKRETGETIGRYIVKAKLEEAKLLLAYSDTPLPAISNILYFSSQSYFQNLFKKAYGMTPKEYRRSAGKA